jgi:hypothetical protein
MAFLGTSIPSAVRQVTTQNFISGAAFTANLEQGLIDLDRGESLVNRYGSENLTGLLTFMGAKKEVESTAFLHYEGDWLHQTFTFDTTVSSGTTFTNVAISPLLNDDSNSINAQAFVRVNDIIVNELGDQAIITAVTAADTTLTISGQAYGQTNFSATTDMNIAITGNAWQEYTDQPDGITPLLNEYRNQVQIIKEGYDASGSAMTERIWIPVQNADGSTGYLWTFKGEKDTYRRFMNLVETQMITGKGNDGTNGQPRQTEGLEQFARSGNTYTYENWDIDDWDAIIDRLDTQRGMMENLVIMGHGLKMDSDKALFSNNQFDNGAIQYGAFNGSKEIGIGFGFSSFHRSGFTFHTQRYTPFSYPKLLGALGNRYKGAGCVIPVGETIDPKTGEASHSLRIRYKAAPSYSRELEYWLTGSANIATPTNERDGLKVNYRTERAFEGFYNNKFVWIQSGAASSGAEVFS